jgi:hypothetical protein
LRDMVAVCRSVTAWVKVKVGGWRLEDGGVVGCSLSVDDHETSQSFITSYSL